MNEINKDELLDINKWKRFFFMVLYSFAINAVVSILIFLAAIQFFIYLFTSKVNPQLQNANNWLQGFFNDSLNFLSFNTNTKPWPFSSPEDSDVEKEEEIVEGDAVELSADDSSSVEEPV